MMRHYQLNQYAGLFSEGTEHESSPTYEQWLARRQAVIEEDFFLTLFRWCADAIYLGHPRRIAALAATLKSAKSKPRPGQPASPDARFTRPQSNGFIAAAHDLSPAALLDGYGRGLLLHWLGGSPAWWSPAQRVAGAPAEAIEPKAALQLLASSGVRVTLDREYDLVAKKCASNAILRGQPLQPGREGLSTLTRLHDAGFAHSVEVRDNSGNLIAGCHGVANGRAFITQASFGSSDAAEDLALMMLNRHLAYWNFCYHDISTVRRPAEFGFRQQSREDVQSCLAVCLADDRRGRWLVAPELCEAK